jgi:hypothetical protein
MQIKYQSIVQKKQRQSERLPISLEIVKDDHYPYCKPVYLTAHSHFLSNIFSLSQCIRISSLTYGYLITYLLLRTELNVIILTMFNCFITTLFGK